MSDFDRKPKRALGVFALVMITTGIITSIHGAPSMAYYGFSLVFIYLVVALVFLLPSALISAELATGWPEDGGVYVWVKEAFGERLAFVAVWQQWIENVIWFPSILTVTVVSACYGFAPEVADNRIFIFVAVNCVFWSLTLSNLLGMRTSGMVASVCTIFGRIIPILFMFGLACLFMSRGNPSNAVFTWDAFVPDLTDSGKLSFIVGAFLTFAGIEASASNAASAKNPRRNYPIAIITSAGIALVLVTLIALSIAIVLPADQIKLDAGIMQAIHAMFKQEGLLWLFPVSGLIIALGMLGEINNWIPAPTRGLLVAGRDGVLSKYWQRENKHAVHWRILVYQAVLFTTISTMYLFMKNVQDAFWLMNVVPAMLYIIMYILMFASGVKLRYSHPEVPRRYRVPFGNVGIWALASLGTFSGLVAVGFAFVPPQLVIKHGTEIPYIIVVTVGFVVFSALPFVIYTLRRPEWRTVVDESVPE